MTAQKENAQLDTKGTILTSVTDDGEVLVTMPSGRMVFRGFWQAAKFCFAAILQGYNVKAEDD